jgi:hypothetical protein
MKLGISFNKLQDLVLARLNLRKDMSNIEGAPKGNPKLGVKFLGESENRFGPSLFYPCVLFSSSLFLYSPVLRKLAPSNPSLGYFMDNSKLSLISFLISSLSGASSMYE